MAPNLARQVRPAKRVSGQDFAGAFDGEFGGSLSPGRPSATARPSDGQPAVVEELTGATCVAREFQDP